MYEGYKLPFRTGPELSQETAMVESVFAGVELLGNLESIDILDLVHTAICFYDKLTQDPKQLIGLCIYPRTYTQQDRIQAINAKFRLLNTKYKDKKYMDPKFAPLTVKDLLIKIEHLAFYQLPEYTLPEASNSKKYLNWNAFIKWMTFVMKETG